MRIYFAIDLSNGYVVRGKGGERDRYKVVGSVWEVLERFDPKRIYFADLDRIEGKGSNLDLIESVAKEREVIADLGFRDANEVGDFNFTPIVATETFDLRKIVDVRGKFFVSLDFRDKFLSNLSLESALDILNTLDTVVIVLTIDRVGTLKPNFELVEKVIEMSENPVMAGGGISSVEDLERFKEMGCYGAIVATAVYEGRIPREVVRRGFIR